MTCSAASVRLARDDAAIIEFQCQSVKLQARFVPSLYGIVDLLWNCSKLSVLGDHRVSVHDVMALHGTLSVI